MDGIIAEKDFFQATFTSSIAYNLNIYLLGTYLPILQEIQNPGL